MAVALRELHAAGLAAVDVDDQDELAGRWSALPVAHDPLLDAVDLHGQDGAGRGMLRLPHPRPARRIAGRVEPAAGT